ncbi:MAG: hypothetical protein ACKO23_11110 [Gemmataceae bacterium]
MGAASAMESTAPKAGEKNDGQTRMANSRRIKLNFEIKDVGPSGLAGVDLWITSNGKAWKKLEAPVQAEPYVLEVDEDGKYGFTLIARNGLGQSQPAPVAGDQPQTWVIVDTKQPEARWLEATAIKNGQGHQVDLAWKVDDTNLGSRPVTLHYAESEQGPWKMMGLDFEAQGRHTWQAPQGLRKLHVKLEARDQAGNVITSIWPQPLFVAESTPSIKIVQVEAKGPDR